MSLPMFRAFAMLALAALPLLGSAANVTTVGAAADNTLIQDAGGERSNGSGDAIYAGPTQRDGNRRALLRFDLGAIPPGATITSATLSLTLLRTRPDESVVTLRRSLQDWGEGASAAFGGVGTAAQPGDATWLVRFFGAMPAKPWAQPGGDASSTVSAQTTVSPVPGQAFLWTGSGVVADAQAWVDNPGGNHGWIIDATSSAKGFASREYPTVAQRPTLSLTWTPPPAAGGADVPLPPWALVALGGGLLTVLVRRARRS